MGSLARQLDDKTPLVLEVGHLADGAVVVLGESLAVDAVERVDKLLRHALQPRRGVVDVVLERSDEGLEKGAVVLGRARGVEGLELVLEEAE